MNDERPLRLVIADDQTAVREGLVTLLGLVAGIDVVGAAGDGREAVRLTLRETPDVVLMDLRMPRMDGVEATRRIRAQRPQVEVVVLSTHADDSSILDALRAGARGFLTKDAGRAEIALAVRAAAAGHVLFSPQQLTALLLRQQQRQRRRFEEERQLLERRRLLNGLTLRERTVLELIVAGLDNKTIARRLSIGTGTVRAHVQHVLEKLGVHSKLQAAALATERGLVSTQSSSA
jgi:DNA-binding NarL/FixJ family response regulator